MNVYTGILLDYYPVFLTPSFNQLILIQQFSKMPKLLLLQQFLCDRKVDNINLVVESKERM